MPMKWPRTQQTGTAGLLFVQEVVNGHGSIFRPVHQETDVGIDGHIELVDSGTASGRLVAVQIKSGDSYLVEKEDQFRVPVDEKHLSYWKSYMVPVILVCYSPTKSLAAWTSVRDYVEQEEYLGRVPITSIRIPLRRPFDKEAMGQGITGLARARADEGILLRCADKCLSPDSEERRQGFSILSAHPDSRGRKITAFFARQFLFDESVDTAKDALFILGYAVGRFRWSWRPGNKDEAEVMDYAHKLCRDFSATEVRCLVELVDEEHFSGPQGLGERCFDVLMCCDLSEGVLEEIASDRALPMERRANALYMLYGCDDGDLQDYAELAQDGRLGDVYRAMYGEPASEQGT